jgi:hypothetical protein
MTATPLSSPANLIPPSQAYEKATLTLVYKLSELTFGSLLAAYSLGFVSLIAARWDEMSAHGRWGIVLLCTQYASISISFVYLTVSFYLTYHTGILTMPQMPLTRPGIDFSLAIVQALFFGFSMIFPWSFPILLGINFWLTGLRKRTLHKGLAKELYASICNKQRDDIDHDELEKFRHKLVDLLRKDFSELTGWGPTGKQIWLGGIVMSVMGLAVVYLVADVQNVCGLAGWIPSQKLITFELLAVTAMITPYGWGVLRRSAGFWLLSHTKKVGDQGGETLEGAQGRDDSQKPEERLKIDEEFDCLRRKLAELCTG